MLNSIDNKIKSAIFSLLREQESSKDKKDDKDQDQKSEKPARSSNTNTGVISTTGALGSGGRAKAFVTAAKSRAKEDPEGLMKDLGIEARVSGVGLDAALQILRVAIHSNVVMSEAYSGAKKVVDASDKDPEKTQRNSISITLNKIDRKNGIRFLAHTLVAAKNAKMLRLGEKGLQFARGVKNSIILYEI